jgi:hypothetical protein
MPFTPNTRLGTPYQNTVTPTINYSVQVSDDVVLCTNTAPQTVTMPLAAKCVGDDSSKVIANLSASTQNVTIAPSAGDAISGSLTLTPGQSLVLRSAGAKQWVGETPFSAEGLFTAATSTADSKGVSAGVLASTASSATVSAATSLSTNVSAALSAATSVSVNTSIADSKAVSDSITTSTADSKGVSSGLVGSSANSAALSVSVNTSSAQSVGLSVSLNTSIADSKAVSDSVLTSTAQSGVVSGSTGLSTLTSRVSSKGG